jgi:hypothetical protein
MLRKVITEIIKQLAIEKDQAFKIKPTAEIPQKINQLTLAFTHAEQY